MSRVISLAFFDEDLFFIDGLNRAIFLHFEMQGYQVVILPADSPEQADMVFQSVRKGLHACFCLNDQLPQKFFSLRKQNDAGWVKQPHCQSEAGVIYRNEPLDTVMLRIQSALATDRQPSVAKNGCYWCEKIFITAREKEIMRYLSMEMTPAAIADRLNLSIKTVSSHKGTVMRKLGFSKSIELYRWLLRDGLKNVRLHTENISHHGPRQSIQRRAVLAESTPVKARTSDST
ncbi:LuxR C-terminal-related transcriptional regulator [Serratia sp. BW106]|uniref:helix-turn-helix transcriptional regulator n=1 Tax=Serratia sp. BW106 TaxID=1884636 RepID=UPI000BFF954A|nr:LuxR C-terminal-related transcriptional regulator [Serratia sp. BW106]